MYTSAQQIRTEIEKIMIGFVWEANPQEAPAQICQQNPVLKMLSLQRKFAPFTKPQAEKYQKEIVAEYCWMAYSKSLASRGDMAVGRQSDLARQGLYDKVAELVKSEIGPLAAKDPAKPGVPNLTFLDKGVHGNLLNQDKWAGPVNDAWVLGGIHRKANFRLTSPRIIENLWNTDGFLVVTAREILGLLCFGYELQQIGPWQVFVPGKDQAHLATSGTLTAYANYLSSRSTVAAATRLMELQAGKGTKLLRRKLTPATP